MSLQRRIRPLFILFLYAAFGFDVVAASSSNDVVVATIADVPIYESEFNRYVQDGWAPAGMETIRTNQASRADALEAFLDLKVMVAKARKDGVDKRPLFQKASELMEMKVLVQTVTEQNRSKFTSAAKVSDEEIQAYYDERQDEFKASHEALESVKKSIANQLQTKKLAEVHKTYMTALYWEVDLKKTSLATNDAPLHLSHNDEEGGVLATIGKVGIHESDFEWFLKDAFRPEQRAYVLNRPGARQQLLNSYLDMRVLHAKARKDGLDHQDSFRNTLAIMEAKLLAEFLQERDRVTPWLLPGATDVEREEAFKKYLRELRSEMRLKAGSARPE